MKKSQNVIYECNQKKHDNSFICPINKVCYMCSSAIKIAEQFTLF